MKKNSNKSHDTDTFNLLTILSRYQCCNKFCRLHVLSDIADQGRSIQHFFTIFDANIAVNQVQYILDAPQRGLPVSSELCNWGPETICPNMATVKICLVKITLPCIWGQTNNRTSRWSIDMYGRSSIAEAVNFIICMSHMRVIWRNRLELA